MRKALFLVIGAGVGCGDPTPPRDSLPPLKEVFGSYSVVALVPDSPTVVPLRLTPDGAVVGRRIVAGRWQAFRASPAGSVLRPAPPLEFQATAAADNETLAGFYGGRPALWPVGDVLPTMLFPADTVLDSTTRVVAVSNRGEVGVTWSDYPPRSGVWKGGKFTSLGDTRVIAVNNVGMILRTTFTQPNYTLWSTLPSPFGSDSIASGRLKGHPCEFRRDDLLTRPLALNDSNEVLTAYQWVAGGNCLDVTGIVPNANWLAFNARGLLGGDRTVGGLSTGVFYRDGRVAAVDDLLDLPSVAIWHVGAVKFINDAGQALAAGLRLSDGERFLVLVGRVP